MIVGYWSCWGQSYGSAWGLFALQLGALVDENVNTKKYCSNYFHDPRGPLGH